MSTFKRLLPAPPQVRMHGELINQLMVMIPAQSHNITIIEPIYRQEIQRNKMENNSYYRNIQFTNLTDKPPNLTEDIEMISNNMKFISFSQSPILPPTRDTGTTSVPFPTSISDYNYKLANMANTNDNHKYTHLGKYENVTEEDDREILISVGKIQNQNPISKSTKIKGGTGWYKYRISGDSPKEIPAYTTNAINTYPIPFEILPFEAQPFEIIPSPHDSITTSIGSALSFPNSAPPMVFYPQFGIPVYQIPILMKDIQIHLYQSHQYHHCYNLNNHKHHQYSHYHHHHPQLTTTFICNYC